MQFNVADVGLCQDIDFLLGTNTTTYPVADKTRNINRRLDEVVSFIMKADGLWAWDDNNQTTLPIGTTTLVADQQDYEITAADFLNIREVAVMDVNGKYQVLTAVDRSKGVAQEMEDLEGGDSGMPVKYDKVGNSIMLYPKPASANVTLAAGLKVYFQRLPSYFTDADTTKTPGFNPLFHRVLSLGAAIDYCIAKGISKKQTALETEYQKLNQQMMDHYASRSKDEQATLQGSASERTEIY